MEHHHKLIKSLIKQIRNLQNEIEGLSEPSEEYDYGYQSDYYERKNKQLLEENERLARRMEQERRDAESREWEREDLLKKYERQQRNGDQWGAERTMRNLRNL